MSDDLNNLYWEADRLDREFNVLFLNSVPKWSGKREALYANGPIYGMYREGNETLLVALDKPVDIQRLKFFLERSIDGTCEHSKKIIRKAYEFKNISEEVWRKCQEEIQIQHDLEIEHVKKAKCLDELFVFVNSYNSGLIEDLKDKSVECQLRFLQIYFEYDEHKKYKTKEELFSDRIPKLDELYDSVFDKKSEYKKYDLIPIDEYRTLRVKNPPRIYDAQIDKTIMLRCSKCLAEVLYELFEKKLIGEMAFKGSSEIHEGEFDFEYCFEEVECGRIFSFDIIHFAGVTKLYSKVYEDQLWIIKNGKDIYFEELDKNFADYEDSVITKLIHVEIKDDSTIDHMDFEYIFYTIDEFDKRKQYANTEGTGKKRRKLFKIDSCNIPFDYVVEMMKPDYDKIEVPFLYFVLNICFEHKDLIKEYFSEMCG